MALASPAERAAASIAAEPDPTKRLRIDNGQLEWVLGTLQLVIGVGGRHAEAYVLYVLRRLRQDGGQAAPFLPWRLRGLRSWLLGVLALGHRVSLGAV
jgi:hypothetical protein